MAEIQTTRDVTCRLFYSPADRPSGSHNGADRVSRPKHLRVSNSGVEAPGVLHHGARRTGQQDQRLFLALRRPLQ